MRAFIFIKEIISKYHLLLLSSIFLLVSMGFFGAVSLFTISPIIDIYLHPDLENISSLTNSIVTILRRLSLPVTLPFLGTLLVIFASLSCAFRVFARYIILKIKFAFMRDILVGAFEDFFSARWYFFCSNNRGTLLNAVNRELMIVGNAFSAMGLFFANLVQMCFLLAVPFYISWKVTLISLGIGIMLVIPFSLMGGYAYRLGKQNTFTANKLSEVICENFSLAKLILGFGQQQQAIVSVANVYDKYRTATIKSQILNLALLISYRPVGLIMTLIVMSIASNFGVGISEMTVLLLSLFQAGLSIGNMNAQKNALDNFFPSYEQIQKLRQQARTMEQKSGNKKFIKFSSHIELKDVSFCYHKGEQILDKINLIITKGQVVAFVGKSGSGKTTLVDIIMGLHEPTQGKIFIDGVYLYEYDVNSYRKHIGYVPQESVLFNTSIRNNLLWANPFASDEQIQQVCKIAYVDEFVSKFPNGYDTVVGDRGVRLSGGQVQRIALARALIHQPELLILDEATSSLDTISERLIQKAIEQIARHTTIIIVAHRFSTIKNADYIYVLDRGKIIEHGRCEELLKNKSFISVMNSKG